MTCKWSINPITNPHSICSHRYMWQHWQYSALVGQRIDIFSCAWLEPIDVMMASVRMGSIIEDRAIWRAPARSEVHSGPNSGFDCFGRLERCCSSMLIPSTHKSVSDCTTSFPWGWPRFYPISGHVGLVVNKVALGQCFSKYCVCPADSHSTNCSTIINRHTIWHYIGFIYDSIVKLPI
jgi:hypothetical protein